MVSDSVASRTFVRQSLTSVAHRESASRCPLSNEVDGDLCRRSGRLVVIIESAAAGVAAAVVGGELGEEVGAALGFGGGADGIAAAVVGGGFVKRDQFGWRDGRDVLGVRGAIVDAVGLVTDGHAFAAAEGVAVVVGDRLPGTVVDDRLPAIEAGALFAFPGADSHAAKLDAFHNGPRLLLACHQFDAVKASVGEGVEETVFAKRTADAAAPQLGVVLEVLRNVLVADDIADDGPSAPLENAVHLGEELPAVFLVDEIEHAVGDDDIDGLVGDERRRFAERVGLFVRPQPVGAIGHGMRGKVLLQLCQIELQVLNAAFAEIDVVVTDAVGDRGLMPPGE